MSVIPQSVRPSIRPTASELPPLEAGDRLDQPTFHARYEAMPPGTRAELIGGIVHMPSPVGRVHSKPHGILVTALGYYGLATGAELHIGPTTVLGDDSEPQPDAVLLTVGGQTPDSGKYISGGPELVCEVASSTESIDLHAKKSDYDRNGAGEYLVVAVRSGRVFWFVRDESGKFVEMATDADGLLKSRIYPGLWLDPAALLRGDVKGVIDAVNSGLRWRDSEKSR